MDYPLRCWAYPDLSRSQQHVPKLGYHSEENMNGLTKRALATSLCFGTVAGMQAAISISSGYTNTFDSLAGATAWLNDTTMPGWYANRTTIVPSDGTTNPGGGTSQLYHFGNSTERALGGNGSGAVPLYFGASFQNTSGDAITSISISYTGEQWRRASGTGVLEFQYLIGNPAGNDISAGTWVSFNPLNFNAVLGGGSNLAMDGNNPTNQAFISATITGLSIAANENFWIRWRYLDADGNQPLLGIDNFQLQVVPEPSTYALIGVGALVGWSIMRRRRA